jgi:predicted unusual protein kinase regulating ubiquinone biosynthesis (AarF/ABC1/UbiB family)
MGERVGLAAGPLALVGVLSTYAAAVAVDVAGNYRVMWLFPTALGLINAVILSRLWIPPWATRVDMRGALRGMARRPRAQTRSRPRDRNLFTGEVDVDDADASVIFEIGRHALGNPYVPPTSIDLDEPASAVTARRVISVGDAPNSAEVADVAALIGDDAVLVDDGHAYAGQPAVIERLTATAWRPWDRDAYGRWQLAGVNEEEGEVTFQASPPPRTGEIDIAVGLDAAGRVTRIERTTRPTLAQQADAHARGLGYPVPTAVTLDYPSAKGRRRRALLTFWVIGRHLGGVLVRRLLRRPIPPIKVARGLRKVFERLGAGYVKFGQLVASSPSLFGDDVAEEFRTTLDAGPVVPAKQVRAQIEAELGRPFGEVFSAFDPVPLGRASIAVVHRATTVDGREVAVKVIRPGIEDVLATDLALMEPLFLRIAGPSATRLAGPLLQMLDGFRRQVSEEVDLRNEAAAMAHYRGLLAEIDLPAVVVPQPVLELTSRRVLTMELLDGVAIDDISAIEGFGVDPAPLLEQVVKAWFLTAIIHGTFHGDVHAGNLMLLRDGRVALIDWGIVARLDPATHGFFRHLIAGALGREAAWDEIAAFFGEMFGPLLARADLSPARLAELFRPRIEAVLTKPFGEMSLGALISDNQREAAEADGETRLQRRERRRARRDVPQEPTRTPPFNRGLFLLGKQLMYFERYGRMYLSDVALLEDREFYTELVERAR